MNKRQRRLLAQKDPKEFRKYIMGERRDLTARHLLLHLEEVASLSGAAGRAAPIYQGRGLEESLQP